MFIVDPSWIKRTTILSVLLALPSLMLLERVWKIDSPRRRAPLAIWCGFIFLITYAFWFADVLLGKTVIFSVMFMVGWPLFGILTAVIGCLISLFADKGNRSKLVIANGLLFVLALASIIAPN
jgi:hypothetical protein